MSKIVITSSGNTVKSDFDLRFGRAAWFCIFDDETKETKFYENEHINANHGAGTQVAEKMLELKVTKAISGDFGPKAKELLDKFNVQMVIVQEETTVESIINKLITK
ncbi:MAG: hypothetical protein PF517_01760 [Salinivirgaceae bacterium]|jgi:predicted Fe-Mo cluster-binding NifX family protein|nr:hypothetical protein [Salinivirgaceae bacterium]